MSAPPSVVLLPHSSASSASKFCWRRASRGRVLSGCRRSVSTLPPEAPHSVQLDVHPRRDNYGRLCAPHEPVLSSGCEPGSPRLPRAQPLETPPPPPPNNTGNFNISHLVSALPGAGPTVALLGWAGSSFLFLKFPPREASSISHQTLSFTPSRTTGLGLGIMVTRNPTGGVTSTLTFTTRTPPGLRFANVTTFTRVREGRRVYRRDPSLPLLRRRQQ